MNNIDVSNNNNEVIQRRGKTVYCHFSFKRPTGKEYGLFAVALYSDFEGKKLITQKTRQFELWENHQFVTAIQSYEHALMTIYEMQGLMREANINQVMLVTDNSTLAGWIEEPKKNKNYSAHMENAVKAYRTGSFKEIVLGVGLCEPRKSEKSYKYCKPELVCNNYVQSSDRKESIDGYKLQLGEYKSAIQLLSEDKSIPEISGISTVK